MESSSHWKDKLTQFRIKELKDVLTQLGLAKQGKKQDLMDRISGLLSDEQGSKMHGWGKKNSIGKEGILKIIDDTYRKMQIPGAIDLASKSPSNPDYNNLKPKEEVVDSSQNNAKVRCLCGITSNIQSVIQCEDIRCQVWQHLACVDMEGIRSEAAQRFYCEICRINRADAFWITLAHPLLPIKLTSSTPAPDGSMTVQNTEKTFQLTRADRELLQRADYDLQVWCVLLNDKVPFRMQWPQYVDLQVNGVPVRTINRPGSQLLGINGRDDGPVITTCSREGINKICLSRADSRVFCFGIRIARRRTLQQVLGLVPKESEGENFEDALARVCRCIGGGTIESADSDSDLEVVAESNTVNLRCPMSGSRMRIAGRFKPCVHMGCFDLETFVELNQRSRKWQCPICLNNYTLENIIIDPYFNRITSLLRNCGEDVNEIEVKPDGCWRAKNEGEYKDLGQWHLPDGSLCIFANGGKEPELDTLKQIKQETGSDGQTSLKFKKNLDGIWEVSKTDDMKPPASGNHIPEKFDTNVLNIPMSSSATGSYRDGEDASVNQEGGGHFDFSMNNNHEFNSSTNFNPTYNVDDRTACKNTDIIVLSDSEEDLTLISPNVVYGNHSADHTGVPFLTSPVIPEPYSEDHGIGTAGTSQLDLLGNADEYNIPPPWSLPTCPQAGPGLQLFNPNVSVQDDLADMQPNSLGCAPMNGYGLPADGGGRGETLYMEDLLPTCPNAEVNGSLVDNPLAFGNDDPALQIFLPTTPADISMQANINEHTDLSQGIRGDDWISLRLGGAGASQGESAIANGLDSRLQYPSKEGRMDSISNTASLLTSMHEDRSNKVALNNKRSDGPFSHPRQPRSVRSRMYLSIDTDSE